VFFHGRGLQMLEKHGKTGTSKGVNILVKMLKLKEKVAEAIGGCDCQIHPPFILQASRMQVMVDQIECSFNSAWPQSRLPNCLTKCSKSKP
jgi:hypothetical protein